MLKKWFDREIMACLNVISSLANNDVHSKDDVVSDKVPTLQQTKSQANVQYSKDLPIEQEEQR